MGKLIQDGDCNIYSLDTNAEYQFDQDRDGNLWFARGVKSALEVYKYDGQTASKFTIKEEFEYLNTMQVSIDEKNTVWYELDLYPPRKVQIGITTAGKLADEPPAPSAAPVKSKGKDLVLRGEYSCAYNTYCMEIFDGAGKLIHTLDPGEADPELKVVDIDAVTFEEDDRLIVALSDRHNKRRNYLYSCDLNEFRFKPHRLNGSLKKVAHRCFFGRDGKLWVSHLNIKTSKFKTTFSVIDSHKQVEAIPPKKKAAKKKVKSTERKLTKREREQGKLGLKLCKEQAKAYGVNVPEKIQELWKTGEIFKYDALVIKGSTPITKKSESARVRVTRPSWKAQSQLGSLDDAVVGPGGDWKHAGNYLVLFAVGESGYLAVRLDKARCPVVWFDEACWSREGDGYTQGVQIVASTLTGFLKKLRKLDEPTVETAAYRGLWDMPMGADA